MSDAKPTPGTHLRKNQKQIVAMMRAAVVQAGFEWEDQPASSGKGTGRAMRDGAAAVEAQYAFGTNGIDVSITVAASGATSTAEGLYTDTTLIMDALRAALEAA